VFEFLREARLQQAQRLLLSSALSIDEVALEVGFSGAANFSTAFRERFQTPRLQLFATPGSASPRPPRRHAPERRDVSQRWPVDGVRCARPCWLWLLPAAVSRFAHSTATLHLDGSQAWPRVLDTDVEWLEDPKAQLTLEAADALTEDSPGGFVPGTAARMRPGFTNAAFWLRFRS
jgi:hypothetical protein